MIDWLGVTIGLVIFLFALFLGVKKIVPGIACVLCAAVSATWLVLVGVSLVFDQSVRILVALLLAQSSVGIMYAVHKKIPRPLLIFRLAYICSAIVLVGAVAGVVVGTVTITLLAVLWLASVIVFLFRENKAFRSLAENVVACCKDW